MPTQSQRRTATIAAVQSAALTLFAERGFGSVSVDDIAVAAGVTKGAVYHHFETKERLFEAVFRAVEDDLYDRLIESAPASGTGVDLLVFGTRTFLTFCLAQPVHQIVLVDGPNVLGWKLWREIDAEHFLPLILAGLAADAAPAVELQQIAHLLIGAIDEAVMLLASADDREAAVAPIGDGLELMIRAVAGAISFRQP
jgi:AcrR family transcriptional regulator